MSTFNFARLARYSHSALLSANWYSTTVARSTMTPTLVTSTVPSIPDRQQRHFSSKWKAQRDKDVYADRAIQEGLRSRAAYKLEEINQRHGNFLRPGAYVLDLGAAPGGFSKLASKLVNVDTSINRWRFRSRPQEMERTLGGVQQTRKHGRLICLDRNDMEPIEGATFIQADMINDMDDIVNQISFEMDVVLSDMAPDTTGEKDVNHARIMELAELAFHMCQHCLRNGGTFVCKLFSGAQEAEFRDLSLKKHFTSVKAFRPKATRKASTEIYYISKGYVPGHLKTDIDNMHLHDRLGLYEEVEQFYKADRSGGSS